MQSPVENIKERLGIADVIGSYIKLEKAGSNFKAKCPFHNEKTPSFFISPARNTFYCFGCGAKGDAFTFVEQFEGLDFKGALKVLGERAGVPVTQYENPAKRDEQKKTYALIETATQFYVRELSKNKAAVKYLTSRGVTEKTIDHFRIGYAPDEWRGLYDSLQKEYVDADIERAGLIKEKGDEEKDVKRKQVRYYDRFRSRIMFPITDSSGKVVAFSGRIFPHEEGIAKYINSPESPLYNKSRILFGFDKAKYSIRKFKFTLIVEGQMDLVMAHQAGFTNTVAISGTALTEHHVTMLKRLSPNILLALDPDEAGIASAGRSAELALLHGMDVKIATLPKGKDPADLLKADKDDFKARIKDAQHIVPFYLDTLEAKYSEKRTFNKHAEAIVIPFLARIQSKIDQAHFVSLTAKRLGVSEDIVWEEVQKVPKASYKVETRNEAPPVARIPQTVPTTPYVSTRNKIIEQQLLGILLWQTSEQEPLLSIKELKEKLASIVGKGHYETLTNTPDSEFEEAFFIAEQEYTRDSLTEYVEELMHGLQMEYLQMEYETVLSALRQAEAAGKQKEIAKRLSECKNLTDQISALKTVR